MAFDRLLYIDRLREAGVDEPVARAHADALRESLLETVATKADAEALRTALTNKVEIAARDLTIHGAGGLVILAGTIFGPKLFG